MDGNSSLAYNYLDAKEVSSIDDEISSDAYDRNLAFGNDPAVKNTFTNSAFAAGRLDSVVSFRNE